MAVGFEKLEFGPVTIAAGAFDVFQIEVELGDADFLFATLGGDGLDFATFLRQVGFAFFDA